MRGPVARISCRSRRGYSSDFFTEFAWRLLTGRPSQRFPCSSSIWSRCSSIGFIILITCLMVLHHQKCCILCTIFYIFPMFRNIGRMQGLWKDASTLEGYHNLPKVSFSFECYDRLWKAGCLILRLRPSLSLGFCDITTMFEPRPTPFLRNFVVMTWMQRFWPEGLTVASLIRVLGIRRGRRSCPSERMAQRGGSKARF